MPNPKSQIKPIPPEILALADQHAAGEAREMLLQMANEELKHKEKVEYLYSNTAFPQTAGG